MGLPSPFVVFMHFLTFLFVSLILTCLNLYVCPWSELNGRKALPWLACDTRAKLLKLRKWTISSFWWKEINLRLTATVDFNGLTLVEQIITYWIGPLTLNGLRQHLMIEISQYKPSEPRNWEKNFSWDHGIEEPYQGPSSVTIWTLRKIFSITAHGNVCFRGWMGVIVNLLTVRHFN